jgi:outer membrane immunogenic protein
MGSGALAGCALLLFRPRCCAPDTPSSPVRWYGSTVSFWKRVPAVKRFLLGSLGLVAMATSAFAADLAARPVYKAPSPVIAPISNWTGFYVGGELGGEWGQTNWTTTSTSDFPGTIVDASFRRNYDPSGFRAGGYAGYNWQITNWVVGLEGSGAWTNNTASAAGIPGCSISCAGTPGPGLDVSSVKMGWDASVRARVGYLVTPSLLFYGTGGVAWQAIQTTGLCQHSSADPVCSSAIGNPIDIQTNSKVLTGWTVGGGVDAKIYGNWLLRGEYRYSSFGTFNGVLPFNSSGAAPGADFVRYNLSVKTQVATVGLAYKFDWGGPVVARY